VRSRRTLSEGVDRFVELRTRQAADWGDLHDATFRDALHAASAQAGRLAIGAVGASPRERRTSRSGWTPTITRQTRDQTLLVTSADAIGVNCPGSWSRGQDVLSSLAPGTCSVPNRSTANR